MEWLILGVEHCAGGAPFSIESEASEWDASEWEASEREVSERETPEREIVALEPADVRRLILEGVMLLDARSARDHAQAPHGDAVHLSHRASRLQLRELPCDRRDPLVCASNREQRARRLAVRLSRLGYRHVYVLRGGLAGLQDQPPD